MAEHGGNYELFYEQYGTTLLYDFSANLNPLGPPPGVLRILRQRLKDLVTTYPDYRYQELYEEAIKYFATPNLVLGNGASSLLNYLLLYLKPKRGLILTPTFSLYEKTLKNLGIPLVKLPFALAKEGVQWVEEYLQIHAQKEDMLFLCRPNNPNGEAWPISDLFRIYELCQTKGVKLLLDESFADFMEREEEIFWRRVKELKNTYILVSLTKIFAIPGLRLGALILPFKDKEDFKRFLPEWEINNLASKIAPYLFPKESYLTKTRSFIKKEREYLQKNLTNLGFKVLPAKANFLMAYLPPGVSLEILLKDLAQYQIAVRPLQSFGIHGAVRIAVKTRKENRVLINALKNLFQGGE